ncbi:hypothetical protein N658DRAFT_500164 [Parathielavia hyrcaniae]|uniref:Uncharacterized protein n=1 Tax=Parathielavia hyrcaniae TaxID=113614 RepID=A0AAN6PX78_9PEZI|nr:hypothetical protein N658DRAFT_500164 [Parathielavia hyrcaniae]
MLLRHLPYLRPDIEGPISEAEAGPCGVKFWKWIEASRWFDSRPGVPARAEEILAEGCIMSTQPLHDGDPVLVPRHVVGLISESSHQHLWMLDTELGVIYWVMCPGSIRENPAREPILDDCYDYAPESEAAWRHEPAWAIVYFFELLKDQFRQLCSVPVSPTVVPEMEDDLATQVEGALVLVQAIYREHGWPDLARYRKEECMKAIRTMLEERYGEDCWMLGL